MPLVFAAALGGNLSIIGAPGNLMGVNALQEMGLSTSFFMYAPVGVPMLIFGILYFVFIGYRFLPDGKGAAGAAVEEQKDFSNVPKWKQIVSLVVLVLVILAMIFEEMIGISIQLSACIGAIVLVVTGVLSEKEALTNFMSNTATTALMIPIAVSLANNLGADPRAVVIATVIAGSCAYATPIGMPETLWCNKVKEFGPLIVSIDAQGRNLFEENKVIFNERKEAAKQAIYPEVKFIK